MGSRITNNWKPSSEDHAWARNARPELDLATELTKFRNHWSGEAGEKACKLDWSGTWRNWILRAYGPHDSNGHNVEPGGQALDAIQALEAIVNGNLDQH